MKSKNKKAIKAENDIQHDAIYDETAKFVAERYENSKRSLLEIGKYLLEHFFGGDIKAVKSKKPGKGLSLQKLSKRDDINMSLANLSRAVNLAAQEEEIGSIPTSEQLTLSHMEVLLGVEDLETKKRYMQIAIEEKLSVRQLEERLKKDGVAAGNGAEEDARKTVILEHRRLDKAFEVISSFSPKTLKKMNASTAQATLAKAEEAQQGLAKVIEVLRKRAEVATDQAA